MEENIDDLLVKLTYERLSQEQLDIVLAKIRAIVRRVDEQRARAVIADQRSPHFSYYPVHG